jgi:HPt (histidine-containing phosphotransfer) domain-containing protein
MMKFLVVLIGLPLWLAAQTAAPVSPVNTYAANPAAPVSGVMSSFVPDLDRLQAAASQTVIDIAHLRIDKWKTDSQSKQQAQSNADSIQRNLTSALPELIDAARAAPQDLTAEFKLYRNLNALHDVLGGLTESAGAFGPRSDFESLTRQYQVIASVQHDLGEALERLTASTQLELGQLRAQVLRAQQQSAVTAPPKKVVVDDTAPASKTAHKKKKAAGSSSGAASAESGSNSGTTPKS